MERLVYWCYNSDHLGVRGEVPRLIAWLIKHCHLSEVLYKLLDVQDVIRCLVEMTSSSHSVMQNEAFMALNILHTVYSSSRHADGGKIKDSINVDLQKFYKLLITADVAKHLTLIICKCSDKQDIETINSILTLLENLIQSQDIVSHLKTHNTLDSLRKLSVSCKVDNLQERIKCISTALSADCT